jgi:hypothetical protein
VQHRGVLTGETVRGGGSPHSQGSGGFDFGVSPSGWVGRLVGERKGGRGGGIINKSKCVGRGGLMVVGEF